jgi:hypothetical protein
MEVCTEEPGERLFSQKASGLSVFPSSGLFLTTEAMEVCTKGLRGKGLSLLASGLSVFPSSGLFLTTDAMEVCTEEPGESPFSQQASGLLRSQRRFRCAETGLPLFEASPSISHALVAPMPYTATDFMAKFMKTKNLISTFHDNHKDANREDRIAAGCGFESS